MRDLFKLLFAAFELAALVAGIINAGPIADGARTVALVAAVLLGTAVVFVIVVWTIGVLANREPPYPI